ncbi:hypothetical protein ACH42_00270 [Endozoicomonas sp. (ex Bugula neritina AB1)]|nr:hypothetical protein ACH42_00270 [Endozoicomonas sp. (ex Bugula neritina AB1)]
MPKESIRFPFSAVRKSEEGGQRITESECNGSFLHAASLRKPRKAKASPAIRSETSKKKRKVTTAVAA